MQKLFLLATVQLKTVRNIPVQSSCIRHSSHDHFPPQSGEVHEASHDAEAYQRLLDIAAQADAQEGIGQGREDLKKARVRPARKALEVFRRNHAIPR